MYTQFNKSTASAVILTAFISVFLWACSEGFDPFNEVQTLRVLAIKSEPAELPTNSTADLSALVYSPTADTVDYQWSWCPLPADVATGQKCPIAEQDLRDQLDAAFPGGSSLLPAFDMGNQASATFPFLIPTQLLQLFCATSIGADLPEGTPQLSCEDKLEIQITLKVTSGEEQVIAVKALPLLLSEALLPNRNPSIGEASYMDHSDMEYPLLNEQTGLVAQTNYDISITIPETAAEQYTVGPSDENPTEQTARETLFMTWFVTGGDTKYQRTTFIDNAIDLEALGQNAWETPSLDGLTEKNASLFLVLQDNRGGIAWRSFTVGLEEG